jgi:hypothetical protein
LHHENILQKIPVYFNDQQPFPEKNYSKKPYRVTKGFRQQKPFRHLQKLLIMGRRKGRKVPGELFLMGGFQEGAPCSCACAQNKVKGTGVW